MLVGTGWGTVGVVETEVAVGRPRVGGMVGAGGGAIVPPGLRADAVAPDMIENRTMKDRMSDADIAAQSSFLLSEPSLTLEFTFL